MSSKRPAGLAVVVLAVVAFVVGAVSPASAATSAADSFSRTVSNGLGTADGGGAWSLVGPSGRFSVGGGTARLSLSAATELTATLATTTIRDTDVVATVGMTALARNGSVYQGVLARRTGATEYAGRVIVSSTGAVTVNLMAGQTSLRSAVVPGLTVAAGTGVRIRLQVTGVHPTTVRARAWRVGAAEPTTWQVSTTDGTAALQTAGAVGIRAYLGSGTTNGPIVSTVDDLVARSLAPVNAAPTASFTATPSGATVAFDATGSRDADGSIASYAWTFGDGTSGTGARPAHTYAAPGTYTVGLTVTDNAGATASTSRSVTVTPAGNRAPVPTLLQESNATSASFWGDRSTDPDGTVVAHHWAFGDGTTGTGAAVTHTYATPGSFDVTLTVTDDRGATAAVTRRISVYAAGTRPTQAQWLADLTPAVDGGIAHLEASASVPRPAIVLDIDNTSLQSYYGNAAAVPAVLEFQRAAIARGYTILFATGRSADTGGTLWQLQQAGYRVDALCFRDPAATSTQASKTACRAAWTAQGYTIVANRTTDLLGGNSGQQYLLPNYGFLD
ncbi:PKD domain-containing protein [Blastococcus sp. TF02A-26]|uniref:PKD domain-containing protein n=1 Tax=Blastococcus sp. TF02A-26 TaxID=2250577 RepID=UPI000DEBC14F|nr:PKD domain-containing protein [Blastococcus sp. TF02A-26]